MEVFEIKKRGVDRQSSRSHGRSKIGYVLAMACMVLFTFALLVVLHFTRGNFDLTTEAESLQETFAEKLEGEEEPEECEELPFCNTKECVSIAATMLESMNPKIDPCTDFYGYVCGRYPRVKEVPYGMDFYSPLKDAQLGVLIDIRKTMDGTPLESESFLEQRMRRFYASCMNTTERNEVENRTLTNWFDLIGLARKHLATEGNLDQGYIFDSVLDFENVQDWTELVATLEDYGIHTILTPRFVENEDSAPNKMEINSEIPFLKPEAYVNDLDDQLAFQKIIYREALNQALDILQMDREERYQFVDEVFKLETDIARAILESSSEESSADLTEENKQLLRTIWRPYLEFVEGAMHEIEFVPTSSRNLQVVLSILKNTPNKVVTQYVFWRMLMQLMPHLGAGFRSIHLDYMTKLPGTDYAYDSGWKQCGEILRTELGMVTTKMLMDNGYFRRSIIDAVNGQFLELKKDIALVMSTVEDLNENFINLALDKLKAMKLSMGYPDILEQDEENWLNAYDGWVIHDDDHLMNFVNLRRFKWKKHLNRLWYTTNISFTDDVTFRFHPVSRISLDENPLATTSSYDYISNTVHADLGLFRSPLYVYSENIPSYLNYAYTSVLAREMNKAFDFMGMFYDAAGHRIEKMLWPTTIEERYDETLNCLKNQTEKLKGVVKADVDDIKTLNNIIVDVGAFIIPFEGMQVHLRGSNEKPLPGVTLTKKQTYFVQRAQMFCELRNKPSSDPEDQFKLPPKYRVNRAIANVKHFGEVFNCPADSAMTVEEKCGV